MCRQQWEYSHVHWQKEMVYYMWNKPEVPECCGIIFPNTLLKLHKPHLRCCQREEGNGELAPLVLGGLRPPQIRLSPSGRNKEELTQVWGFRKSSHPAARLMGEESDTEELPEFRWDPLYQAAVLTASRHNVCPGAEFFPDKLLPDPTHFHYKQWGSDIFSDGSVQELISA